MSHDAMKAQTICIRCVQKLYIGRVQRHLPSGPEGPEGRWSVLDAHSRAVSEAVLPMPRPLRRYAIQARNVARILG